MLVSTVYQQVGQIQIYIQVLEIYRRFSTWLFHRLSLDDL